MSPDDWIEVISSENRERAKAVVEIYRRKGVRITLSLAEPSHD